MAERINLASVVWRVPKPWVLELKELIGRTRLGQSVYLREAIADLLAYHSAGHVGEMPGVGAPPGADEVAIHVLAPAKHAKVLRDLSKRSKLTQVALLREALAALLLKYRPGAGGRGSGWLQSVDIPDGPVPRAVFPRAVTPDDFEIEVVAHALAGKPRFSAHCRPWYGVGQHSVGVSLLAWKLALQDGLTHAEAVEVAMWGLLHEGDEVYLPDLASPIKDWPEFAPLKPIAARHQAAVCQKYSLPLAPPPQVKRADLILLATEKRDVMGPAPLPWPDLPTPMVARIVAQTPEVAAGEFLEVFHRLERARRRAAHPTRSSGGTRG